MSLDIYLIGPSRTESCECECCGHSHTREVADTFFQANITHNLNKMADAAGLYAPPLARKGERHHPCAPVDRTAAYRYRGDEGGAGALPGPQ